MILFERKQKKLSWDDIYCVLKDKIPNLYPMKIYRCLKRYGLDRLPDEFIKEERRIKRFKRYKIGFLHIDILYTPKINKVRGYIFTCIDRVSKLTYVMLTSKKSMHNSRLFLEKVLRFYPYKIKTIS